MTKTTIETVYRARYKKPESIEVAVVNHALGDLVDLGIKIADIQHNLVLDNFSMFIDGEKLVLDGRGDDCMVAAGVLAMAVHQLGYRSWSIDWANGIYVNESDG